MERFPITKDGYDQLQRELKRLKAEERPTIIGDLINVQGFGESLENPDYQAVRRRQEYIEGKIAEFEDKLSRANIIDTSKLSGDIVKFGAKVSLLDEHTNKSSYRIVSDYEADLKESKISLQSPMAVALIGKKAGSSVAVNTPSGRKHYQIVSVEFSE
jgi:transcription elongation factor GreA